MCFGLAQANWVTFRNIHFSCVVTHMINAYDAYNALILMH